MPIVATRSPLAELEALEPEAEEEEPLEVAVVMVESVLVMEAIEDEALSVDIVIDAMDEEDMAVEPRRRGQSELSCAMIRYTNPKMGGRTCQ